MSATKIIPKAMKAFLGHIATCPNCHELPEALDLCQEGHPLFLRWSSEAQLRNETQGAETDPQRAVQGLRYFSKGFVPGDVVLPKATALAVHEYIDKLTQEVARLALNECKHDTSRPQCQCCGALCPICPLPTDIHEPPEVTM